MKNTETKYAEFRIVTMTVINGSVCFELHQETGRSLAKSFMFSGTWYIKEADVRFISDGVYRAALKPKANPCIISQQENESED